MRTNDVALFFYMMLLSTPTVAEQLPQIVPVSGETRNARIMSISDDRVVFLDEINHERPFAPSELVRWGSLSHSENQHQVFLTDGSQLVGQINSISRTAVALETDVWGELTVPRKVVAGVVWETPTDRDARWKFQDQFTKQMERGRLLLRNGDFMQARLSSGDHQFIKFQSASGEIELKSELVAAWQPSDTGISTAAQADDSTPSSVVGLRDGTKLVAHAIRLDHRIEIDLVCGLHIGSLEEIRPVDERLVTYFRPQNPNVKYLSDLPAIGHKHIPFLSTTWDWRPDRNVLGGPITSANSVYAKGVGMHSTARLAYDLPSGFDEFQAEASIDQSSGKRGSVVFRVFLSEDGAAWSEEYRSDTVVGGDLVRPVRVNIESAKRIALVVDFADRGDQLDRANWIGARLVKTSK
jgi:hypothetical protein